MELITFTKVALPYGWLGNMAPYPIEYENKVYRTTEALFQSLRFNGFPEIQEEIREQKSPMTAKMVAKKYKHELVNYELCGEQDIENMKKCVRLKLEQHPKLKNELLETQNIPIIEDCTARPQGSGIIWGAALQNGKWIGQNILGKIWEDQREELRIENKKKLRI